MTHPQLLISFLSGKTPDNLLTTLNFVLVKYFVDFTMLSLFIFQCHWLLVWTGNCENTGVKQPFPFPRGLVLSNVIELTSCQRHSASFRIRLQMHTILFSCSYESQLKGCLKLEPIFFVDLQLFAKSV